MLILFGQGAKFHTHIKQLVKFKAVSKLNILIMVYNNILD